MGRGSPPPRGSTSTHCVTRAEVASRRSPSDQRSSGSDMAKLEDYSATITDLCERALVTVVGDIGFWADHLYLVGGLAPKYIVGSLPEDGIAHVGSNDVDL